MSACGLVAQKKEEKSKKANQVSFLLLRSFLMGGLSSRISWATIFQNFSKYFPPFPGKNCYSVAFSDE